MKLDLASFAILVIASMLLLGWLGFVVELRVTWALLLLIVMKWLVLLSCLPLPSLRLDYLSSSAAKRTTLLLSSWKLTIMLWLLCLPKIKSLVLLLSIAAAIPVIALLFYRILLFRLLMTSLRLFSSLVWLKDEFARLVALLLQIALPFLLFWTALPLFSREDVLFLKVVLLLQRSLLFAFLLT